ncbi:MAG: hypothetical protein WC413_00920 [Candidatus Nanoarchaeia archaeon]
MGNLLGKDQKIVYYRNGEKISEVLPETKTHINYTQYLRYFQPFTEKGNFLTIRDFENNKEWITSRIEDVQQVNNSLNIKTKNSQYVVEYVGIDLEKMLKDGKFKGVNDSTSFCSQFPILKTEVK